MAIALVLGLLTGGLVGFICWRIARRHMPLADVPMLDRIVAVLAVCSGIAFGAGVAGGRHSVPTALMAVIATGLLATLSLIDLATRRLPNTLVLGVFGLGLIQPLLGIANWRMVVTGMAFGALFFGLLGLAGRGALGAGDVKLAIAIGTLLGLPAAIWGLTLGILAGGVGAVLLLVTRSATRKDKMAYGPYLAAGAWVTYMSMLGLW